MRSAAACVTLTALISMVPLPTASERPAPREATASAHVDEMPAELLAAVAAPAVALNGPAAGSTGRKGTASPSGKGKRVLTPAPARTGHSGLTQRRSALGPGIATGDDLMRTALAGPESTEGRASAAMTFRSRVPVLSLPERDADEAGQSATLGSGDLVADVAGAKDELLTLAYAPTVGTQASRFDHILREPRNNVPPPIGPDDHSWAATPLPSSAFASDEQTCLATGIYFEARGETEEGQAAVAQVILNRVRNPAFPDTICGVVYQNRTWKNRCQFSFACDGFEDRVTDRASYATAEFIAHQVTNGETWLPSVGSATNYHATYVNPRWANAMKRVDKIGSHIFYRTFGGGWN